MVSITKKAGVLFQKLRPCKSIFSIGIINKIVHEFLWTIFGGYFASLTRKFSKKANHFRSSSLLRVKLRFKSGRSVRKIYGKKEKIRASKMPGSSWCVWLCARRIYTAMIRWRCRPDLNWGVKVLQTFALPLGHGTDEKSSVFNAFAVFLCFYYNTKLLRNKGLFCANLCP